MDPASLNRTVNNALFQLNDLLMVQQQLLLHTPNPVAHIQALPKAQALLQLPIARKIAALANHLGIGPTLKLLQLEDQKEAAEKFAKRVEQMTQGVINSRTLDSLDALRMLFFADFARLSKQKVPNFSQEVNSAFALFKIVDDSLEHFEKMKQIDAETLQSIIHFFEENPLEKIKGKESVLVPTLRLFEKVRESPVVFLPLLLNPLRTHPIKLPLGLTLTHVDQRIHSWFPDFWNGWKWQVELLFSSTKDKINKLLRDDIVRFTNRVKELSEETLKLFTTFQKYEQLTPTKRWSQKSAIDAISNAQLFEKFQKLAEEWRSTFQKRLQEKINKLPKGDYSDFICVEMERSYKSSMVLAAAAGESLHRNCLDERSFNRWIEATLDPKYKEMSSVTVIDLLQYQCHRSFVESYEVEATDPVDIQMGQMKAYNTMGNLLIWMRRYYALRKHRSERALEELTGDMRMSYEAGSISELCLKFSEDPRIQSKGSLKEFFQLHGNICAELSKILWKERWPRLFLGSPFGSPQFTEKNERAFLYDCFKDVCTIFLHFEGNEETILPDNKELRQLKGWDQVVALAKEDFKQIRQAQILLQKRVLTADNFEEEAQFFLDLLRRLQTRFEGKGRALELELGESFEQNENWKLDAIFSGFSHFFDRFLSPCQPLVAFLNRKELEIEERTFVDEPEAQIEELLAQASLPMSEEVEEASGPTLALVQQQPPPVPERVIERFGAFKKICQSLIPYCQNFTSVNPVEGRSNAEHLHHHLTNLIETLPLLEEIVVRQELPPYATVATYLKVAVALEQSAMLAAAIRNLEVPHLGIPYKAYEEKGYESLWDKHAPHRFVEILQKAGATFDFEQLQLVKKMARVVSVSSRYPAFARDALFYAIGKPFHPSDEIVSLGLKTCIDILQWAAPELKLVEPSLKMSVEPLLSIPIASSKGMNRAFIQKFLSFKESLNRINLLRLIPGNCEVPSHSEDRHTQARLGTITTALEDIEMNLRLLANVWVNATPDLCLTSFSELYLRQAVILEKLLIVNLAHLPDYEEQEHYLFKRVGNRFRRQSHALVTFSERLPETLKSTKIKRDPQFFQETRALAAVLEPMLKVLYRYHSSEDSTVKKSLDQFKGLSLLRQRLHELSPREAELFDESLGVKEPQERFAKLEAYIAQVIETQGKLPVLHFLDIAGEWLKIYEESL